MENEKGENIGVKKNLESGGVSKSLQDLKRELQDLGKGKSLLIDNNGRVSEKDKWNNHAGGIVPQ